MAKRPIDITVVNDNTDVNLTFSEPKSQHGTTPEITAGDSTIKSNGGQCTVHAQEKDPVFGPGPQGSFKFDFDDDSGRAFNFSYNHPMGTGETYVNVTPPDGYTYSMTDNHLAHHNAYCTIKLQKLAD
ncbi:MAG: hypothetical protein KAT34_00435 [Candidatus Aminicenantes bacterium]|nr:hypothetical protein [Candidatus Aminicenantes bacterium]